MFWKYFKYFFCTFRVLKVINWANLLRTIVPFRPTGSILAVFLTKLIPSNGVFIFCNRFECSFCRCKNDNYMVVLKLITYWALPRPPPEFKPQNRLWIDVHEPHLVQQSVCWLIYGALACAFDFGVTVDQTIMSVSQTP